MNGNPKEAWNLRNSVKSLEEEELVFLLQVIGNDCYRCSMYLYAAKAFHSLNEINNDEEFIDALIPSCVGAFQNACSENIHRGSHSYEVDSIISDVSTILSRYNENNRIKNVLKLINQWKKI